VVSKPFTLTEVLGMIEALTAEARREVNGEL
jgi:hypothetical protein